jgi:hypothetical protein
LGIISSTVGLVIGLDRGRATPDRQHSFVTGIRLLAGV